VLVKDTASGGQYLGSVLSVLYLWWYKPNAMVTGKNSCDIPSVSGGNGEISIGTLLFESDLCNAPISGLGTDFDYHLGHYGVKAGCLHCKDLVEVGLSSLRHSRNCPRDGSA
jgi:hypothetical protein